MLVASAVINTRTVKADTMALKSVIIDDLASGSATLHRIEHTGEPQHASQTSCRPESGFSNAQAASSTVDCDHLPGDPAGVAR